VAEEEVPVQPRRARAPVVPVLLALGVVSALTAATLLLEQDAQDVARDAVRSSARAAVGDEGAAGSTGEGTAEGLAVGRQTVLEPLDAGARAVLLEPDARVAPAGETLGKRWLEVACRCASSEGALPHGSFDIALGRLTGNGSYRGVGHVRVDAATGLGLRPAIGDGAYRWTLRLLGDRGESGDFQSVLGRNRLEVDCRQLSVFDVTVVDEDGAPLPGAELVLRGFDSTLDGGHEATTDGDGRVLLGPLPFHVVWSLEASLPGRITATRRELYADPDTPHRNLTLVLPRAPSITATVVNPDDSPLPNTLVVLRGGELLRRRTTDGSGKVTFTELPSGPVELLTENGSWVNTAVRMEPTRHDAVTLRLQAGELLRVELRGADGPSTGAVLYGAPAGESDPLLAEARTRRAVTNPNGVGFLGPLPPGTVRVTHPDSGLDRVVPLTDGVTLHEPLMLSCLYMVQVLDGLSGEPVQATGALRWLHQEGPALELSFDEEGKSMLPLDLPTGHMASFELALPGLAVVRGQSLVPDRRVGRLDFTAPRAPATLLHVLDDAGLPVRSARVYVLGNGERPLRPSVGSLPLPPAEPGGPARHASEHKLPGDKPLRLDHPGPPGWGYLVSEGGYYVAEGRLSSEPASMTVTLRPRPSLVTLFDEGG
jgi:hypothetical protein